MHKLGHSLRDVRRLPRGALRPTSPTQALVDQGVRRVSSPPGGDVNVGPAGAGWIKAATASSLLQVARSAAVRPPAKPGAQQGVASERAEGLSPTEAEDRRSGKRKREENRATESKSDRAAGGHPRRQDLPTRHQVRKRRITTPRALKEAVNRLTRDKYTPSTRQSQSIRADWWKTQAKRFGFAPYPLTAASLVKAAAILKANAMRSAAMYLYTIKRQHLRLGFPWTPQLQTELTECRRSCNRGLGPARQAEPFDLQNAPADYQGVSLRAGAYALIVGTMWLMRESELAALRKCDVVVSEGRGCGAATINLATGKTDLRQKGAYRTLACTCPTLPCPVQAAVGVLSAEQELQEDDHLIRNKAGEPVTKAEVVKELQAYAVACGTKGRITGHSMRVTGAQRLAWGGASIPRITLFGRWAGKLMLH